MSVGEIVTLVGILVAGGAVALAVGAVWKELRATRQAQVEQAEAVRELTEAVGEAAKRLTASAATGVGATQGLTSLLGGSLASLQTVLVESREATRAGMTTLAAALQALQPEMAAIAKVAAGSRDAVNSLRDVIDVGIKASEKTQVQLKAIVDSLLKHTQVADEVGRLLPRVADGLLSKVVDQLAKNGEAVDRLPARREFADRVRKALTAPLDRHVELRRTALPPPRATGRPPDPMLF